MVVVSKKGCYFLLISFFTFLLCLCCYLYFSLSLLLFLVLPFLPSLSLTLIIYTLPYYFSFYTKHFLFAIRVSICMFSTPFFALYLLSLSLSHFLSFFFFLFLSPYYLPYTLRSSHLLFCECLPLSLKSFPYHHTRLFFIYSCLAYLHDLIPNISNCISLYSPSRSLSLLPTPPPFLSALQLPLLPFAVALDIVSTHTATSC